MSLPTKKEFKVVDERVQKLFDLSYDATNQCIQCGYCLPACPTYESMGKESASPRGRINLVKMAAEGKIDIHEHMAEPIDLCLGCRACEVACPVGVPYGHILEAAKEVMADPGEAKKKTSVWGDIVKNATLTKLFPYPKRLRALGNLVFLYQKTGLDKVVRKTKIINKISGPMAQFEKVLPPLEAPSKRNPWGVTIPAKGETKARVAFFAGCVMDAMMYRTNRLTIELLTSVGCEVVIPEKQNCCGALHAHQGLAEQAKEMAKANIEAFERSGADYYINNAGGCGAILREYDHLLAKDEEWVTKAKNFVNKSKDISEILAQYGPLPFKKEWNGIITYQDSCHLRNVQGVSRQPRQLLESIPGATFVEMEGSDRCCASGGIYNILHFKESMEILDDKMNNVKDTKATTIVTSNPGCLLQMRLGVERQGCSNEMEAVHLVEVLAEACGLS
jgi:glycolate oxidase iron-sulfur subunit